MARTVIAGGGIGGLAAALSITAQGHRVTVLERRETFAELGAGIQLGPNAFHALDRLGVGDAVRERAVFVDELRYMDGTTGERVTGMPVTGAYRERFGNPYAVVHRDDLYQPLLDACRRAEGVQLLGGRSVAGYERTATGATAVTGRGERFTADALIGADGIHSAVRRQLVGDGDPLVSGHTIYRSVIPMDRVPEELRRNDVTLWAGPKWHFVHYAIGGGEFLNLAAARDDNATQAVAGLPVRREKVLHAFPELGAAARALLELGAEWKIWVLCDRDPVDTWTQGRVALLGDAAHPMLPYSAQGACMALEDAVVVGHLLDCGADEMPQRLERYSALRRARTARVQLVARQLARTLHHLEDTAGRTRRNGMLSAMSVDDLHDEVAWLHGLRDFASTAADGGRR